MADFIHTTAWHGWTEIYLNFWIFNDELFCRSPKENLGERSKLLETDEVLLTLSSSTDSVRKLHYRTVGLCFLSQEWMATVNSKTIDIDAALLHVLQ